MWDPAAFPCPCSGPGCQLGDDRRHRFAGSLEALARIDDEIRQRPLLRVGNLLGQDHLEFRFRHAGPRQHAVALDLGRRSHHHDLVDAVAAAGLEQ